MKPNPRRHEAAGVVAAMAAAVVAAMAAAAAVAVAIAGRHPITVKQTPLQRGLFYKALLREPQVNR